MLIPEYVIMDASLLVDLQEALGRATEQDDLGDIDAVNAPDGLIQQMIDDYVDNLFACIHQKDTARQSLDDYMNHLLLQEHTCDFGQFKIAEKVWKLGEHLYAQVLNMGGYYAEEYFPYYYHGRYGTDAVYLIRATNHEAERGSVLRDTADEGYCRATSERGHRLLAQC